MGTKITGTNTAAAPGVTGDDTDTGLFYGTNEIGFSTSGTERVRIAASGQIGIAGANYGSAGQVLTSGGSGASVSWSTATDNDTVYDDTKLRRDLNILALHTAIDNNKAAHNLSDSFIDQFEGSTGVGTATNSSLNTDNECYATKTTSYSSETEYNSSSTPALVTGKLSVVHFTTTSQLAKCLDGATNDWGVWSNSPGSESPGAFSPALIYDIGGDTNFGEGFKVTKVDFYGSNAQSGRFQDFRVEISTDGTNYSVTNINSGNAHMDLPNSDGWHSADLDTEWELPSGSNPKLKWAFNDWYNNGTGNCSVNEIRIFGKAKIITINATGTIIGVASTASSSRTKVSGVMLYKNDAGTATIGTDLKIYFTCNGGTNWTEAASYTTSSDFSTGVKTIHLGETTCTAGTDVRYKAEWANQSATKVTQLHGIGVNY